MKKKFLGATLALTVLAGGFSTHNIINAKAASAKKIVVIDAAHGGEDPGATGKGVNETEITLSMAKKVKKELKKDGYKVVMTRPNDEYVMSSSRLDTIKQVKADYVVSLHANAAQSPSTTGTMTYYADDNDKEFAKSLQKEVSKSMHTKDKGVYSTNDLKTELVILDNESSHSAVLEVGFLTNKKDRKKLVSKTYQVKLAKAIAKTINNQVKKSK